MSSTRHMARAEVGLPVVPEFSDLRAGDNGAYISPGCSCESLKDNDSVDNFIAKKLLW